MSRVVKSGLKRLESAVVSSLYALACIDGDTFDHLRWAAATETLTERQRECLYYLLSEDASLAMIADHLNLYKSTVSHTNTRIVGRMAAVGEGLAGMRPRRVVHRSEWRNKSEDEVAAALGISRGTYYRHICMDAAPKLARMAQAVWNMDPAGRSEADLAAEAVDALAAFIAECGLPTKLSQLRSKTPITPALLRQVADSVNLLTGGPRILTHDEVYEILPECL